MKVVFLMKDVDLPDQGILVKLPVSKSPKFHKKKLKLETLDLTKEWIYDYFSEQIDNILDSSTISKLVNEIVPYCAWSFPTFDYEGMSFKIYCLIFTLSSLINNVLDETVKVESCKNDSDTRKVLLSVFNSICNRETCNNDLEIVGSLWESLEPEPLLIQIFSITTDIAFMVKSHCGHDYYEKYARPMLFSTFGKIPQINMWKKSVSEDELFSLSEGTYRNFRIMADGSAMFDVILCLHNVKLPQQFRMNPQVQQLLHIYQSMVAIVNDVFGFKTNISDMKTFKGGPTGMLIYKLRNGINCKDAIVQEITLFDNLMKDFEKLSDLLLKSFQEKTEKENEKYVEQFLEILAFCIEGHIFGTCLTDRCGTKNDIIFE